MKLTLLIEGESSAELIAILTKLENGDALPAAPAKTSKGKKAAAGSVEEDPFAAEGKIEDDEPKHTKEDVLRAGAAYMKAHGKNGKDKVFNILKKFGVKNASGLTPDQYADAIEAFEV